MTTSALLDPPRPSGRDDIVTATLRAGVPAVARRDYARLLTRRHALYLSTPITGGPEFVERRIALGARPVSTTSDPREVVLPDVVRRNASRAARLRRRVRAAWPAREVIDPNDLPQRPWTAETYNRFWGQVLTACVSTAVFADGWEESVGCAFEFAVCLEAGIARLDSGLAPIPDAVARARLLSAARRLRAARVCADVAEACLARLDRS